MSLSSSASSTCAPTAPRPGRCAPTVDSAAVDRLWFASMAYLLLAAIGLCPIPRRDVSGADRRRLALPATRLARATAGTIRLKRLKLGALVRISVRRVAVQMASGQPWQRDWAIAHQALPAAAG